MINEIALKLAEIEKRLEVLEVTETEAWIYLTAPLTSTSWDGDAKSTASKTLLDLSSVFGAPAGIRAILVYVSVNDSGSAANDTYLVLSPNNTANQGMVFNPFRSGNDHYGRYSGIVPCDANGDIYYQIAASGANTFDVVIQIWGYLL